MDQPYYLNSGLVNGSATTTVTSRAPAKPSATPVYNASDLLLCVVMSKNNAVHSTTTAGWTKLTQVNRGTLFTVSIFYANGAAAAPTITWTGAAVAAAIIHGYRSGAGGIETGVGATSNASGTTSPHTSPSVTSTRSDSLAVYIDATSNTTALGVPAGWSQNSAQSGSTAARLTTGSKFLDNLGDASGAISVTGGAVDWVQFQLEIRSIGASSLQSSGMEIGAWQEPPPALTSSGMEMGAWQEPPPALTSSGMEMGAWLEPTVTPTGYFNTTVVW